MEENPQRPPSYIARIKTTLTEPRTIGLIVLALALGASASVIGKKLYLKPVREAADARYQSHLGLMRLYDLQMAYHKAHGTYANDLDTLLASASDGAELRAKLAASVDINTLAVIGDEDRFRLEVNIRDGERTPVKIRGPLGER